MSKHELNEIVEKSLRRCTHVQRVFFASIRVDTYSVPIRRGGMVESVLVIAHFKDRVIYFEDIEEGFAVGSLDDGGAIPSPDCSQFELQYVLSQLQSESK